MTHETLPTAKLRRVRWGVRAVLILGLAVSVVANVLHAVDNPISQSIAAWPPLALLLTVELISRVPVHSQWLAVTRLIATAAIAGIAAWVSYWHMVGVAAKYGETNVSAHLLPLSVDGLIVVASICLVELGGRIAATAHAEPARLHAEPVHEPAAEDEDRFADELDHEPVRDPWALYAIPYEPEPVHEPPADPVRELVREPIRRPRLNRSTNRSTSATGSAAERVNAARVLAAHSDEPDATHGRIAQVAGVSVSTVKRHRPARVLAAAGSENR